MVSFLVCFCRFLFLLVCFFVYALVAWVLFFSPFMHADCNYSVARGGRSKKISGKSAEGGSKRQHKFWKYKLLLSSNAKKSVFNTMKRCNISPRSRSEAWVLMAICFSNFIFSTIFVTCGMCLQDKLAKHHLFLLRIPWTSTMTFKDAMCVCTLVWWRVRRYWWLKHLKCQFLFM